MSLERVAKRYAQSLLEFANEQNQVEVVKADIEGFKVALESRDLVMLLKSPIIEADKKWSVLNTAFEGKFSELTTKFLELVVLKGRENCLEEIADQFLELYFELKGITKVKLTTAVKATDAILTKVKSLLSSSETAIEEVVDASIIGGFVLEFGDKKYDASVARSIEKLKINLN